MIRNTINEVSRKYGFLGHLPGILGFIFFFDFLYTPIILLIIQAVIYFWAYYFVISLFIGSLGNENTADAGEDENKAELTDEEVGFMRNELDRELEKREDKGD